MAERYVIGVDIGTTGAKSIIFDFYGRAIASGYFEYTCSYPKPTWIEQDVDLIVGRSMEATAVAVKEGAVKPEEVAAISFSTQRCCTIFVDRQGGLVRPMISWQDNRAVDEFENVKGSITPDSYYDITALPLNTTWMISKILWLRTNEPENWKKTARIVQLQDYALKTYGTEDFLEDMSDTGFSGLWDPYAMAWSDILLDMFSIPKDMFPKVVASGTSAGVLSSAAAECTGLKPGIPLIVGAGDQNSAAVGAGIVQPGYLSVSLGTGGLAAAWSCKCIPVVQGRTCFFGTGRGREVRERCVPDFKRAGC